MGKYSDFPPRHKIYSSTPQSETTSIPVTYMGLPPPGPHFLSLLLGVISSVNHNQLSFSWQAIWWTKYSSFLQFETRLTSENLILTSCFCLRPRARTDIRTRKELTIQLNGFGLEVNQILYLIQLMFKVSSCHDALVICFPRSPTPAT